MIVCDSVVLYMLFVFILELVQVFATVNSKTIEYCKFRSSGILNYYRIYYYDKRVTISTEINTTIVATTVIISVETATEKAETRPTSPPG